VFGFIVGEVSRAENASRNQRVGAEYQNRLKKVRGEASSGEKWQRAGQAQ